MPDNPPTERLHAVVKGRVQGVGFRYYVQQHAVFLNVNGWVRNVWDGSVEWVGEGTHEALLRLLGAVYQGPSSSMVEDIKSEWLPATGEFTSFRVKI